VDEQTGTAHRVGEMETDTEQIRHFLFSDFDKGSNEAAACHNIQQVYGEDTVNDSTCRRWFRKFRDGEKSCQERGSRQTMRNSQNPTVEELGETVQVHRTTVERRLESLGFTTKLDRWLPHQLSATTHRVKYVIYSVEQLNGRGESRPVSLLSRYKNSQFLTRIVTCCEMYVLYRNIKRPRTVFLNHLHQLPNQNSSQEGKCYVYVVRYQRQNSLRNPGI